MTSYAAPAALADYVNDAVAANSPYIADAAVAASRMVDGFCGRDFADLGTLAVRYFEATGRWTAPIDDFSTTTGLIVQTDDDDSGTWETTWTIGTDFEVAPINGRSHGVDGFPFNMLHAVGGKTFPYRDGLRRQTLKVTARWGWATIPDAVARATLILGAKLVKIKDAPLGVAGFDQFGDVRVRDVPEVRQLLDPYRTFRTVL